MNAPIQQIITRAAAPGPPVVNEERATFWAEFLRVQSDKLLLLVLIVILHHWHAPTDLQAGALGGFLMLIQGQRFRLGK